MILLGFKRYNRWLLYSKTCVLFWCIMKKSSCQKSGMVLLYPRLKQFRFHILWDTEIIFRPEFTMKNPLLLPWETVYFCCATFVNKIFFWIDVGSTIVTKYWSEAITWNLVIVLGWMHSKLPLLSIKAFNRLDLLYFEINDLIDWHVI